MLQHIALLVTCFAAYHDHTPVRPRTRGRNADDFSVDTDHIAGPGRLGPAYFAAGTDDATRQRQAAADQQAAW